MQEEVENRTMNLAVTSAKLSAKTIISAAVKALKLLDEKKQNPSGKQSLKKLIKKDQGISHIDISKTDLNGFEKYARKYGIDFAVTKDRSSTPQKYIVFFKARDSDAMSAAFNAYSAEALANNERPSVLSMLHRFIDVVKDIPAKAIGRDKQREQVR